MKMNEDVTNEPVNNSDNSLDNKSEQVNTDFGLNKYRNENGLILGKFKNEDDIIKSYTELERKFSSSSKEKVPEKYEVKLSEDLSEKYSISEDDPLLQKMLPVFKESGLSNEKVNKIINEFVKSNIETDINVDEELKKLGDNKDTYLREIGLFANKNFSEQESETLINMARTAEDVLLINKIIGMTRTQGIPEEVAEEQFQRSRQSYLEEAFEYRDKHSNSIGSSIEQQEHYNKLMQKAASSK